MTKYDPMAYIPSDDEESETETVIDTKIKVDTQKTTVTFYAKILIHSQC